MVMKAMMIYKNKIKSHKSHKKENGNSKINYCIRKICNYNVINDDEYIEKNKIYINHNEYILIMKIMGLPVIIMISIALV